MAATCPRGHAVNVQPRGRPRFAAAGLGAGERPAPLRGSGGVAPWGGAWRGPRPVACGATAYDAGTSPQSASPDGGTYARHYHDQEHVNEVGHARLPAGVVPAAA